MSKTATPRQLGRAPDVACSHTEKYTFSIGYGITMGMAITTHKACPKVIKLNRRNQPYIATEEEYRGTTCEVSVYDTETNGNVLKLLADTWLRKEDLEGTKRNVIPQIRNFNYARPGINMVVTATLQELESWMKGHCFPPEPLLQHATPENKIAYFTAKYDWKNVKAGIWAEILKSKTKQIRESSRTRENKLQQLVRDIIHPPSPEQLAARDKKKDKTKHQPALTRQRQKALPALKMKPENTTSRPAPVERIPAGTIEGIERRQNDGQKRDSNISQLTMLMAAAIREHGPLTIKEIHDKIKDFAPLVFETERENLQAEIYAIIRQRPDTFIKEDPKSTYPPFRYRLTAEQIHYLDNREKRNRAATAEKEAFSGVSVND